MTDSAVPDPFPVTRSSGVHATVRPPGSKSQTNRALICGALAERETRLNRPLVSDDSRAMRRCLHALGIDVTDGGDAWIISGSGGELAAGPPVRLDAGASGTTARFVTALSCLAPRSVTVDGTPRMRQRPIGPLVAALREMGARIDSAGGFPPVLIEGGWLRGGAVSVDARASSQFLSSLLMIAPYAATPVTADIKRGLASPGYVETTLEVMADFGITVEAETDTFRVTPGHYQGTVIDIEADASAAVYPWAAAAITGGTATVEGIPADSSQPDLAILSVLEQMGCRVDGHTVEGPERLDPVDIDLGHMPDGAMTVAVLCAAARGTSRLVGLHTLRLKETDRLAALAQELGRVGVAAHVDADALVVTGTTKRVGAVVETYDDHRMAMAFAVLGLASDGIEIADPNCVTKTWPTFFEELEQW